MTGSYTDFVIGPNKAVISVNLVFMFTAVNIIVCSILLALLTVYFLTAIFFKINNML